MHPDSDHRIDKTITPYRALEITSITSTKAMTLHCVAESEHQTHLWYGRSPDTPPEESATHPRRWSHNLIPPLVTNRPEQIHPPHSFNLLLLLNTTSVRRPNKSCRPNTAPTYSRSPMKPNTQILLQTKQKHLPSKPRITTAHSYAQSRVRSRICYSQAAQRHFSEVSSGGLNLRLAGSNGHAHLPRKMQRERQRLAIGRTSVH